jgi:FkbM family methyltransferase
MKLDPLWITALHLARPLAPRTVFDVGAYRGTMSRLFLDAFPHARVHAFEPQPALHAELAARHAGDPRLVAVQTALGDRIGHTRFHVGAYTATSSRFPRNTTGRRYYRAEHLDHAPPEP